MFTEQEAEEFYDSEDSVYRSFWDSEGSLHWGYFDDLSTTDPQTFLPACVHWNERMLGLAGINRTSRVLDLGCGNGNTTHWLAEKTGCEITGVDISSVRIQNARARATSKCSFQKASATALPFPDNHFTHVWSQATLYHVPDRPAALSEVCRVLTDRGVLIFDDLTSPEATVGADARRFVYDRLMFRPDLRSADYSRLLSNRGLMSYETADLTPHLRKSYELLSALASQSHPDLASAYIQMCEAIDRRELAWSFFLCEKIEDRMRWIYEGGPLSLSTKYDAWAPVYDADLNDPYRVCPQTAAAMLSETVVDRNASILDVGAGTGMCGEALHALKYTNIVAADLSEGMMRVAQAKSVYREIVRWDIENQEPPFPAGSFDALICTGVFTFSHVDSRALPSLPGLLKNGGMLAITFREDYLRDDPYIREVLDKLPCSLVQERVFCIFGNEPMRSMIFRR